MNTNQMEALYDKLCAYTPKVKVKKNDIKTTSSFRDRYCGTCVEYSIGDYSVECYFDCEHYPDDWAIYISPVLGRDVRFRLSESARFDGDCPELFEEIDRIAQALETMPSMLGSVRRSYEDRIKNLINGEKG